MQRADKREQAARRRIVDIDLVGEPLRDEARAFVMERASAAIDRLDLRRTGRSYGGVIALADQEIILEDRSERRQRKTEGENCFTGHRPDVERQPRIMQSYAQAIGAVIAPGDREAILFDKIVDGDRSFMLLIRTAAIDGAFIEQDLAQPSTFGGFVRAHDLPPR